MALVKCTQCGNQNAKDAQTCPKCGANLKKKPPILAGCLGCLGLLIVAFLVFALIGALAEGHQKGRVAVASPTPAADTSVTAEAQPSTPPVQPMPADEAAFCKIVTGYADQYKQASSNGENELRLSQMRLARRRDLLSAIARPGIRGWVGSLDSMGTTGEGKAYISVKLPCGIAVKTWNNALSDIDDGTLISPSSRLYSSLASLKDGATVKIAGALVRAQQDGYREASMSEEGSMEDPEYILRFSSVEPQ